MLAAIARYYVNGGFFMHLILLTAFWTMAVIVAQLVLAKKYDLAPLLWLSLVALVLLGVLGTVVGITQAMDAVATAPPDMKTAMLSAGIAIALNTTSFAVFIAVPAAIASGVAVTISKNLRGK